MEKVSEKAAGGELRQVLKYNTIETPLGRFFNLKSALYGRYKDDAAAAAVTVENPGSLMKFVKEYGHAVGVADSRVKNVEFDAFLDKTSAANAALYSLLKAVKIAADDVNVRIAADVSVEEPMSVYVKQPRGADYAFEIKKVQGLTITVQNCFTPYPNEGFTVSFGMGNNYVSICTEQQAGIKGAGTLYVYGLLDGYVYQAEALEHIPGSKDVLKMYRG